MITWGDEAHRMAGVQLRQHVRVAYREAVAEAMTAMIDGSPPGPARAPGSFGVLLYEADQRRVLRRACPWWCRLVGREG